MSDPTLTLAADLIDGGQARASSFVPTNQRVTSGGQPLSVQADVPLFPRSPPAVTVTGTWVIAGTRVSATGIGVVMSRSTGVGYTAVPASSGPMQIMPGNRNVLIKF